ncbi:dihydrofolate reductase family protein [Shewanella sp. GutDb-MelDb]|uniref:dihydrofolate reductase family protein n=1 Tax=Shewanella sp. GutDb-MelDb TaxID=2058316 RepID=UPI000C799CDF|nr:dihydrofolate reductase family protein [Shewanella sp. GutDb-MelDb]PKG58540.1 diacylglycerol kinase [Shewanella sp. GutDb-MelDb]
MTNIVFIATSLDGFIADKDNKVDWLHEIPNPDNSDLGYNAFIERVQALVIGRNTLETVLSFGIDWPYTKPVFVLSNTMKAVPARLEDKVFLVKGPLTEVMTKIHGQGYNNLYIDGGLTIQSFLKEDLIDELIITTIPVLLGGGISLFGGLVAPLKFKHVKSEPFIDYLVQNSFIRVR